MNIYKKFETSLLLVAFAIIPFIANAQKQPQVQEISVRAPYNIKIDGKLNEWANPLLNSYNSTDRIYYVISNDDNNLYLTIRGLGAKVARKALEGGVILTISHSIERKTRTKAVDNVVVMFPVPQDSKTTDHIMGIVNTLNPLVDDTIGNRKQIDSIVSIANTRINDAMKEIRVIGVKEIPDSIVSVYNTEGIKAAAQFIKRQPVIELAIPLKYLRLSIDGQVKFSYNIKFNGPPPSLAINEDTPTMDQLYAENSTDFWGEYTLARKP